MRCRVGLLAVGIALLAAPGTAFGDSVTLFSEPGDGLADGRQAVFDSRSGDRVSAAVVRGALQVRVDGGQSGERYDMTFVAPEGPLRAGVYVQAKRALFRPPGRSGLEIYSDARRCYSVDGNFEVKQLETRPDGSVERAWVVYEQHCDGADPAAFGEVRIGGAEGPTASSLVRWPTRNIGAGGHTVPVVVDAGAAITDVRIEGAMRADFSVREDECTGMASPCRVWVRFVPRAPGTRTAQLQLRDAAGATFEVPLQGFSYGGTTGLTMRSDEGDFIGAGRDWSYAPGPRTRFDAFGSPAYMEAAVNSADAGGWSFRFLPPTGFTLTPGTYAGSTREGVGDRGASFEVYGQGRGCNRESGTFTVEELVMNGPDVRSLSISFEQHCEHKTPALRGTLQYRAGDRTPLAPWLVPATTSAEPAPQPTATPTWGDGPQTATPLPVAVPAPASPSPSPSIAATDPALTIRHDRVTASSQALLKAVAKLRAGRVKPAQAAASRLLTDLRRYRAALSASPGPGATPAALRAIDRQAAAVRELRRALSRFAAGRDRTAVKRAARKLAAAHEATTAASRRLLR